MNLYYDFSNAEISKIPVDGLVLLKKSMDIDKVCLLCLILFDHTRCDP